MLLRTLMVACLLIAARAGVQKESSPILQLEREMLARISNRAKSLHGFRLDSSQFDIRLPLTGEPEEIIGPTLYAATSLAVGSAHLESLDSIASRHESFSRARYDLRIEDRTGHCVIIHRVMKFDSILRLEGRTSEPCAPLYMKEVVRRTRRIARLPVAAGNLTDHWSASLAASGTADVYMDSVVITTTSIVVRASYPSPPTAQVIIDSISAGLAGGDNSWSVMKESAAIRVDTALRQGGEWRRSRRRFMIPIDSTFDLSRSWPVFQVHVRAPVTTDNPSGLAWTYAHERKNFFAAIPIRR